MMARKQHSKRPLWQYGCAYLLATTACGQPQRPEACPLDMPTPPFRLTVDTVELSLSADLEIRIVYGGKQTEIYHPGDSSLSPDICCTTLAHTSAIPKRVPCAQPTTDAATTLAVVVCDLWTGGAANLTIRNGEQVYTSQTLQAVPQLDVPESCGLFETVDARWTYGLHDAGAAMQD